MPIITRRSALGVLGATLATPYILRSGAAAAAGTLKLLGPPIFLGASQPGKKFSVSLAAFPNPAQGFIAGWINQSSDYRNFIQYFKADATPLSAPIPMSGPAGTTDGTGANGVFPIARADGSALILFSAARDGGDEADVIDIFSQRMSTTRTKIGAPSLINTVTKLDQSYPLGVLLANGKFLATWVSTTGGLNTIDARGKIITFKGAGVTIDRRISPEPTGEQQPRSVAALSGGKSVVAYSSISGDNSDLRAVVLKADGTRAHAPFGLGSVPAQRLGSAAVVATGQDKWVAIGYRVAAGASRASLFFKEFDFITPKGPRRAIGGTFASDDTFQDRPPNVGLAGANLAFVQHYGVSNNKPSVEGIVVDLSTRTVKAPRIAIHSSDTDVSVDALIRLPQQQVYVSGFTDGIATSNVTAKAAIQRIQLQLS